MIIIAVYAFVLSFMAFTTIYEKSSDTKREIRLAETKTVTGYKWVCGAFSDQIKGSMPTSCEEKHRTTESAQAGAKYTYCSAIYCDGISEVGKKRDCYKKQECEAVAYEYIITTPDNGKCGAGTYLSKNECKPCLAGTYQSKSNHTDSGCVACTGNQYQDQGGQSSCKTCGTGTKPNVNHTACIKEGSDIPTTTGCSIGQYRGETSCLPCPDGYYCDGYIKCPNGQIGKRDHSGCYTPSSGGGGGSQDACYKDSKKNYYYGQYNNVDGFTKVDVIKDNCNNVRIQLVDDNNKSLQGGVFTLENKGMTYNNIQTYTIGETNITELVPGNYVLKETSAPNNYELDSTEINISVTSDSIFVTGGTNIDLGFTNGTKSINLIIKNKKVEDKCYALSNNSYCYGSEKNCLINGLTVIKEIKDKAICQSIKIIKTDENGNNLQGAVYGFYKVINSVESQVNNYTIGEKVIENLGEGEYVLKEEISPINYQLDNNKINIIINSDGIVSITGGNNVLISGNNTRNVEIKISSSLMQKEEEMCYFKNGLGKSNTYCYGTKEECEGFTETVDRKDKESCDEEIWCYLDRNNNYVSGKYFNQDEYTYYSKKCPACYRNASGEYHWTSEPLDNETLDPLITNQDSCLNSNKSGSNILIYILIILIAIVVIWFITKLKKKNDYRNDDNDSFDDDSDGLVTEE